MNKKIAALAGMLVLATFIYAQPKKGGGGAGASAAPAGAASPTAAAGSQQNGYVYRLPWRYHLFYASINKRLDTSHLGGKAAIGNVDSGIKRTIIADTTKSDVTVEIHQEHSQVPRRAYRDNFVDFTRPTPLPNNLSGYTITDYVIDSVSRYWDRPKRWIHRFRLRVSITPADSGKLQVAIYERGFPATLSDSPCRYVDWTNFVRGKAPSDTVADYAVPIGQRDSAQNLYLQLDNKLLAGQPIAYIKLRYALTQYGAMVIPYKYRFAPKNTNIYVAKSNSSRFPADSLVAAPSESTGSINLAMYIGRKWGYTRFYFDQSKNHNTLSYMASAFVGASLVPLSVGNVKYPKNPDSLPSQAIAFTGGFAATLEWRGIDVGLFAGKDFTSSRYGWIYNKKTWLGFGIGVNLGMFTSGPSQIQL